MNAELGLTYATGVSLHPLAETFEKRWIRFRKELKRAQKGFSEDSVHDVRVASRRLLSALEVIESWTGLKKIRNAKKELTRTLKIFSPVRDAHVQQILLKDVGRTGPAARLLIADLQKQERKRIRKAAKKVKAVKPNATRKVLKAIRQWFRMMTFAGASNLNGNLSALARRTLGARFEAVEALCRDVNRRDMETLHQMRIAFKKYRYLAEFLQPVLPKLTDEVLKRMNDYQTALGDIHDLDVLIITSRVFARKLRRSASKTMRLGSTLRLLNQRKRSLVVEFVQRKDELYQFWPFEVPASIVDTAQPIAKEAR
ncbi:MAG: CHAD domain-containing protein [Bacteroidota bacterium]